MDNQDNRTVSERYRIAIGKFQRVIDGDNNNRKDSIRYQTTLNDIIKEFRLIKLIVNRLNLFSENESLDEINTNYIPFLNIEYYLGCLYSNYLLNPKATEFPEKIDPIEFKETNLSMSRNMLVHYLVTLNNYGEILSKAQSNRITSFKDVNNPTFDEIVAYGNNPTLKRADKIENYKLEKELRNKLQILTEYYDRYEKSDEDDQDQVFEKFDEDIVKAIYIDQLKLFSIKTFSGLELITMELQVLSNRPNQRLVEIPSDERKEAPSKDNDYGYTAKLESLPFQDKNEISDLISKQGKILKPFTITSNKQEIKKKVFGTGQVLPSMSVEEYLDYELANGKMVKESTEERIEEDTEDSEDEIEKRNWDDWKDENPKGSGNMGANLG